MISNMFIKLQLLNQIRSWLDVVLIGSTSLKMDPQISS